MRRLLPLLLLAACGHGAATAVAPSNETHTPATAATTGACGMPADWRADEMARGGLETATPGDARVLAWQEQEDDRPLRIDEALLWIKSPAGGYSLLHVYRHPLEDGEHDWRQSMIYDDWSFRGVDSYDAPPSHAELDTFLTATGWTFTTDGDDYRMLGAGVCADAWQAAFGEAPWRGYAPK